MPLILASASQIRRTMLEQAGIAHVAIAADIDEPAIKAGHDDPARATVALAGAKALAVSAQNPGAWVIGSDSMVTVDARSFDKPASREEAADHLRFFSGKPMTLTSAVALARDGAVDWAEADRAALAVRALSEKFIQSYLDAEWPGVGHCVGVFRLEGPGVQLFESIDGDHFTVLGMPLLPLLGALRMRGLVPS
ncbi:MAG: Maf family protein [Sphingomicrobium sp.]